MSLASHLAHRCTIQRATNEVDPYGNARQVWQDHLLDVPCRLIKRAERVVNSLTAEMTVITTYTLLVDGSIDIRERDRISAVAYDESGAETSGPFSVAAVLDRRGRVLHHKSVALERIT